MQIGKKHLKLPTSAFYFQARLVTNKLNSLI